MRIVVKLVVGHQEVVEKVGARRVARPGNGDELVCIRSRGCTKLAEHPTIRQRVVEHDGVAIVARRTRATEGGEQAAHLEGGRQRSA
ncbi:MAG: hypothetical protein ABR556_00725 [Pyrinomonadaceae bacterium]